MNARERRKAMEWADQQTKKVRFELPEKLPNEPPATPKQTGYIRRMVQSIDEEGLNRLGKWQASHLIDAIKMEQSLFTAEKVDEYKSLSFKSNVRVVVICVLVLTLAWLLSLLLG